MRTQSVFVAIVVDKDRDKDQDKDETDKDRDKDLDKDGEPIAAPYPTGPVSTTSYNLCELYNVLVSE